MTADLADALLGLAVVAFYVAVIAGVKHLARRSAREATLVLAMRRLAALAGQPMTERQAREALRRPAVIETVYRAALLAAHRDGAITDAQDAHDARTRLEHDR